MKRCAGGPGLIFLSVAGRARKTRARHGRPAGVARRHDRLCEFNVLEQVMNVCGTTVVQDAWARDQALEVHGLIYSLKDGRLRDLGLSVDAPDQARTRYEAALVKLESHVAMRAQV